MNTIEIKSDQDLARLRRIALAAQGLLKLAPYGRGFEGARNAVSHLGYVQIDTISVIERAHNHVFRSRVPNFKSPMINKLLLDKSIFEYWTHAAAFLPMADYRFTLPYKHAIKCGQVHWYKNPDRKLMKNMQARIRSDGALRSRDLDDKTSKRTGWWDLKPTKKALEQLYMEGELMVSSRDGFQKTYDLTERVLPSDINSKFPTIEEFATHIIDQQLRCHGLVSLKGLTYQRKNPELRKVVKNLINKSFAEGNLEQIKLKTGELFFIKAGELEGSLPRLSNRMAILSPFDNCVIQRERLKALFQFDYQIECYLPAAKRRYGYFSLPILFRTEFIGRMDCKAHRKTGHLEIKSLHFEKHNFDQDLIHLAFKDAIKQFCDFQECHVISLTNVQPKNLTITLSHVINRVNDVL